MYKYKDMICEDTTCYKTVGKRAGLPEGIVIHGTATENPYLSRWVKTNERDVIGENRYNNFFGGENNKYICPHAVCGLTDKNNVYLVQILPYDFMCWGCAGKFNQTHIQIEMAQCIERGRAYLDDVLNTTAQWAAELYLYYKSFDISDIVSHKEAHALGGASAHGDPENWLEIFGLNMDDFRDLVKSYVDKQTGDLKETLYRVQVGAFKSFENAQNLQAELISKGYQAIIKAE